MVTAPRRGAVVVAGAAGKTGRAVADALEAAGHEVRRLTRADGDLADPSTLRRGTEGAAALYHLAPNMSPDEELMGADAIAAARANDLRLVFHSVLAPAIVAMPHHWRKARVEAALHAAPDVRWTILQPAPYLQNLLPFVQTALRTGRFRLPYDPDQRLAMVDLADVGAAAVAVLDDDRHLHATWELCGEAGVSHTVVAERLGVGIERGTPDDPADAPDDLRAMFRWYDAHGLTGSTAALRWLLGREPRTLDDFLNSLSGAAGSAR
ncbi:MAG: NmrA family NAD(P)-binding protein [Actinomycetota bacterium]